MGLCDGVERGSDDGVTQARKLCRTRREGGTCSVLLFLECTRVDSRIDAIGWGSMIPDLGEREEKRKEGRKAGRKERGKAVLRVHFR